MKCRESYSVCNAFATRLQQKYLKKIGHFLVLVTRGCPFLCMLRAVQLSVNICLGAFMLTDIYSTADIVRQHIMSKIATQSANITALEEWSC